jgi:hypothetical protein
MSDPLPVASTLSGPFWTWVVPIVVFGVTCLATWLLYRHFSTADSRDS